jgi:hypothetical protein
LKILTEGSELLYLFVQIGIFFTMGLIARNKKFFSVDLAASSGFKLLGFIFMRQKQTTNLI